MTRRRLTTFPLHAAVRRAARALPPHRAQGQRRRLNRSALLRLTLSVLVAIVALATAGSLLTFH
jgi:hypothetical protein